MNPSTISLVAMYAGYAYIVLSGVALVLTGLARAAPQVPALAKAASLVGRFATDVQWVIGLLPAGDTARRGFARMRTMFAVGAVGSVLLFACPQAAPLVAPTASLVECVGADAVAKKPLSVIVADCAQYVPAEASAVIAVIESLLASTDPAITSSPAYVEAQTLAAHLLAHAKGAR